MDAQHFGPGATMTTRTPLEAHSPNHAHEAMDVPVLRLHLPTVPGEQRRCRPEDLHDATRDSSHDSEWWRGVQLGDQVLQVAPECCRVWRSMVIMRLELLPHAKHVNFGPYFHDLAIDDPEDIHPGDLYRLACRRKTDILALVCSLNGPPSDNLVMFGNPVVNGLMVIWEGIQRHGYHVF